MTQTWSVGPRLRTIPTGAEVARIAVKVQEAGVDMRIKFHISPLKPSYAQASETLQLPLEPSPKSGLLSRT